MSIRVITAPEIYLVGRQQIDGAELRRFLASVGAKDWESDALSPGEALIETAGRNCYSSFAHPRPGGNAAYLDHILETHHGSVCEHAVFNFIATGISRSLTHEWVRHRVGWSYSQLSQRFFDESDAAFVVPPALIGPIQEAMSLIQDGPLSAGDFLQWGSSPSGKGISREAWTGLEWLRSMERSLRQYQSLIDSGICPATEDKTLRRKRVREAARSVLPNCTETRMFATANGRALRHFLHLRGSVHADMEIRRFAVALARRLKEEWPNLLADCSIGTAADGREAVVVGHPNV